MAHKITNGDIKLLSSIAEYKFLTVKKLAAITQRSRQVIRRRIPTLRAMRNP
jgi:predicted transcriptional regulator